MTAKLTEGEDFPCIYLSAICGNCSAFADERTWCQHDNGPCEECGKEWTEYRLVSVPTPSSEDQAPDCVGDGYHE